MFSYLPASGSGPLCDIIENHNLALDFFFLFTIAPKMMPWLLVLPYYHTVVEGLLDVLKFWFPVSLYVQEIENNLHCNIFS